MYPDEYGSSPVWYNLLIAISMGVSAGLGFIVGGATSGSWKGALDGLFNGALDGFMWGGIFADGSQIIGG